MFLYIIKSCSHVYQFHLLQSGSCHWIFGLSVAYLCIYKFFHVITYTCLAWNYYQISCLHFRHILHRHPRRLLIGILLCRVLLGCSSIEAASLTYLHPRLQTVILWRVCSGCSWIPMNLKPVIGNMVDSFLAVSLMWC